MSTASTRDDVYRPRLPLGPTSSSDNPDLLALMEGITELGTIGTEKGDPGSARSTGWAKESLFGFIDSGGAGSALEHDLKFDLLVCDDMGTEIADFIGLDTTNRRVVAIHAKAFDGQAHLGKLFAGGKRASSQEPRFRAAVSIREAAQTEQLGRTMERPRRTGGHTCSPG